MANNDTLANVFSHMLNCEKGGKATCKTRPVSKVMKLVLQILKDHNYIGDFKVVNEARGGELEINLIGQINNCKVIKPRFSVNLAEYEKFEKRFLPAKDFGILIMSTSQGLMTNKQAKEKGIGGKLIAYCY
ncbi:MAG: 30S ribosomal protein S8 [Candidatus Nanoarchaeia archaeon]